MPIPEYKPAKNEEMLFSAALELPPFRRPAFLDQACGNDAGLRRRIGALLKAHAAAGDLLEPPLVKLTGPCSPKPTEENRFTRRANPWPRTDGISNP